ncbi:DNA-3-methyladenine glycosylase [Gloeocapsa sp. PCC 73106]|uniref:DNA-3-methyladenine glycosylase family protein n=1 Tax=Gloeocapsa sp. PCC 73106 TaxID=102232 RepID=UPI0002AC118F|nr:DNA-3-methyladenine glycosylase [Gloeocapsa sp. PCC 73106]ELR99313.1 HhH-GPD superfamily base excision DNA repair protein [Gloeocapsa sp. PCC 73106]
MGHPDYWQQAIAYLGSRDRIMAELISTYPAETLQNQDNAFYTLTRAIVGQQISVKSADAIWQRFASLLDSFTPEAYLQLEPDCLRQCGLSRQKVEYMRNIALAWQQGLLTPVAWDKMSDQEIAKQLMGIRGIGTWTAEMFLIFHLHRPDILPLGDIGLIKAIQLHYGQNQLLSKAQILEIARMWQPYRTVATWYLWRSLDPVVVQY